MALVVVREPTVAPEEASVGKSIVSEVTMSVVDWSVDMCHEREVGEGVRDEAPVAGVGSGHAGVVVGVRLCLCLCLSISLSLTLLTAEVEEGRDLVNSSSGQGHRVHVVHDGGCVVDDGGGVVEDGGMVEEWVGDNLVCDLSRNLHDGLDDGMVGHRVSHREGVEEGGGVCEERGGVGEKGGGVCEERGGMGEERGGVCKEGGGMGEEGEGMGVSRVG